MVSCRGGTSRQPSDVAYQEAPAGRSLSLCAFGALAVGAVNWHGRVGWWWKVGLISLLSATSTRWHGGAHVRSAAAQCQTYQNAPTDRSPPLCAFGAPAVGAVNWHGWGGGGRWVGLISLLQSWPQRRDGMGTRKSAARQQCDVPESPARLSAAMCFRCPRGWRGQLARVGWWWKVGLLSTLDHNEMVWGGYKTNTHLKQHGLGVIVRGTSEYGAVLACRQSVGRATTDGESV